MTEFNKIINSFIKETPEMKSYALQKQSIKDGHIYVTINDKGVFTTTDNKANASKARDIAEFINENPISRNQELDKLLSKGAKIVSNEKKIQQRSKIKDIIGMIYNKLFDSREKKLEKAQEKADNLELEKTREKAGNLQEAKRIMDRFFPEAKGLVSKFGLLFEYYTQLKLNENLMDSGNLDDSDRAQLNEQIKDTESQFFDIYELLSKKDFGDQNLRGFVEIVKDNKLKEHESEAFMIAQLLSLKRQGALKPPQNSEAASQSRLTEERFTQETGFMPRQEAIANPRLTEDWDKRFTMESGGMPISSNRESVQEDISRSSWKAGLKPEIEEPLSEISDTEIDETEYETASQMSEIESEYESALGEDDLFEEEIIEDTEPKIKPTPLKDDTKEV